MPVRGLGLLAAAAFSALVDFALAAFALAFPLAGLAAASASVAGAAALAAWAPASADVRPCRPAPRRLGVVLGLDADGLEACAGDPERRRVVAARGALVVDQALGLEAAEDLVDGAALDLERVGQRQDRTIVALRGGAEDLAPLQDVINDEGDIVVPVDPRYLGLWLTGLFGDPDTTDNLDGSWDHEFASGGDDLPSYTVEVGMPKVPAFFLHAGVKLNSIALEFTRSGPAAATINAIAQGETRFGTTQGGTPTSLSFSRISQFQG